MGSLIEVSKIWEGRIIDGKFPLRKWIGGSDHSSVFLTERSGQESQKAAIKLISAEVFSRDHAEEDAQLSRWTEIANLSHPNLIRLYECGRCEIDGTRFLYVVMEYADEDLAQILPLRVLTPEEVKEMLPPLAEALTFLHRNGLAHGRIKPANIMAVDNQLKISSDSIVKIGQRNQCEPTAYDAPESGVAGASPAADAWSVGAMLVAVLTQHEPALKKGNDGEVALPETIPAPFREIARQCLRPDPRQRCRVADVVSTVKDQGHAGAQPAEKPAARPADRPAVPPISKKRSKRWMILPIVAALILLTVLFARRFVAQPPPVPSEETHPTETQTAPASPPPAQSPAPFAEKTKPQPTGVARGSVRQQVQPDISRSAQNTITGRVKVNVQLSVDASGKVSQAKLVPPTTSRYFANRALDAAQRWKFNPAQVNGQPSPSEWILRFQFGRTSTQVFPAEIRP
jgi:TonB family protein